MRQRDNQVKNRSSMNEFLQALDEFVDWCYDNEEFEYGNDNNEVKKGEEK